MLFKRTVLDRAPCVLSLTESFLFIVQLLSLVLHHNVLYRIAKLWRGVGELHK